MVGFASRQQHRHDSDYVCHHLHRSDGQVIRLEDPEKILNCEWQHEVNILFRSAFRPPIVASFKKAAPPWLRVARDL